MLFTSAQANDCVFAPGQTGYARRATAAVTDLNYTGNFSVEVLLKIEPNSLGGNYSYALAKAEAQASYSATKRGFLIGTKGNGSGILESYGTALTAKVGDGTAHATVSSVPFEGYAHAIAVWTASSRTLRFYVNGVEQGQSQNTAINLSNISNSADLVLGGSGMSSTLSNGAIRRDILLGRLWNRALSASEISTLWNHIQTTGQHKLPSGFSAASLRSEWLMDRTVSDSGGTGTTHIRDSAGSNHLELNSGARLQEETGALTPLLPANATTGVHKSAMLTAAGGGSTLGTGAQRPYQYLFQVDETPSFNSPNLRESAWQPHYSGWRPILKPGTNYYWRVKVRDSAASPTQSAFTPSQSFTTEGATTWYARPLAPRGTYGTEDGSSYGNAFNGLSPMNQDPGAGAPGIVWGERGVEAGDTLYVCDSHALKIPNSSYRTWYGNIPITASGHSDDHPITIRSDDGAHPGVIWGFSQDSYLTDVWTGPDGNGVYQTPRDLGWLLAQDIEGSLNGVVYLKQMDTPTWQGEPGAFYHDDTMTCVKTTDGATPAGRIYAYGAGYRFAMHRSQHILFKNCVFKGFAIKASDPTRTTAPQSSHVTFDGCAVQYGDDLFPLYMGNDFWTIRNCSLMHARNGVYTYLGVPPVGGANNLRVEGNTITHIGAGLFPHLDAHAVGVQGGEGHVIERNYTDDTGVSICFWTKYDFPMKNMAIRKNFIKNVRGTYGHGIAISGENSWSYGQRTGFVVSSNIVVGAEGAGISSNNKDLVMIANNTIYNCGSGLKLFVDVGSVVAQVHNNIIVNPKARFMDVTLGSDLSTLAMDYNLYYSSNGTSTWQEGSFAQWKARTGCDCHSLNCDPMWASPRLSEPDDFRVRAESLAIDRGCSVGISEDFSGVLIPQGGAPDIGVYENKRSQAAATNWLRYQ